MFFHHKEKRSTVVRLLEAYGPQTLQSLKASYRRHNLRIPFEESGDDAFKRWLKSIEEIRFETINNITKFYIPGTISNPPKFSPTHGNAHGSSQVLATGSRASNKQVKSSLGNDQRVAPMSSINIDHQWKPKQNVTHRKPNRWSNHTNAQQEPEVYKIGDPQLHGCVLIGDDNFLNVAEFDLKYRRNVNERVKQCGHCVSGLKISDATEQILKLDSNVVQHVIINVGSVDIAEGRELVAMVEDFAIMIDACIAVDVVPILTTLAPLPNYRWGNKKKILIGFNHFIRMHISPIFAVIDLYKGMTHSYNRVDMNLFHTAPCNVSGSPKWFVLWNQFGRRRVKNMLIKNLGEAIVYGKHFIGVSR